METLRQCQNDTLEWLLYHTRTFDEHWKEKGTEPYARFPNLPYAPMLFTLMRKERRLFLPKSREMMVSWAVVAYAVWLCQFNPRTRAMIQSQKEDKVLELVSGRGSPGYAKTLWEQQDDYLKLKNPLIRPAAEMPGDRLTWLNGSILHGVPRGADQVRQFHPTLVIFDEAAHLDQFEDAYAAADPVASQIIAISSAAPSWFGEIVESAFQGGRRAKSAIRGCDFGRHSTGIAVFRIKYPADPKKDEEWVRKTRPTYSSDRAWRQEQEIDFTASAGQLVFPEFKRDYTVVEPHEIPPDVTWWMAIDPHPRTPHAFLWMFVDRWGNHVYAREYWPSKGYGKPGNIPEDDELFQIDDYADVIGYLEGPDNSVFGPNGFTDNAGREQKPYRRIMDPAGKAWAVSREMGKDSDATFWDAYEKLGIVCDPAKKDFQAGRDKVGTRLRSRKYIGPHGESYQSQILIFNTCEELIYELENCRYPVLTPAQAAKRDPIENPLGKRKHCIKDGTLVLTPKGEVPIERVRPGDEVLTGIGPRCVTDAWLAGLRNVFRVTLSNGRCVQGTSDHDVWVQGHGWKPLGLLRVGDVLIAPAIEPAIRVVSSPVAAGQHPVYDLTVDEAHEFYASGVLVSNCLDLMRYIEIEDPFWNDPQNAAREEQTQEYAPYREVPGFRINRPPG